MPDSKLYFPSSLTVTEQQIDLTAATGSQKAFYLDLFREITGIYASKGKARMVLGIAGPTGAGKSVAAMLMKEFARQAALPFAVEAITIDAYHFPNSYLLSHFSGNQSLKMVKGRYDTYDAPALARDLRAFLAGTPVSFPAYSRQLHEPVANAIPVHGDNVLLIVEGLWLLYGGAGWEAIRPLLDYSIFIDADTATSKEPVIQRHMRGGRTREDALRHYEAVDASNAALVLATRSKADKIIPAYYSLQ